MPMYVHSTRCIHIRHLLERLMNISFGKCWIMWICICLFHKCDSNVVYSVFPCLEFKKNWSPDFFILSLWVNTIRKPLQMNWYLYIETTSWCLVLRGNWYQLWIFDDNQLFYKLARLYFPPFYYILSPSVSVGLSATPHCCMCPTPAITRSIIQSITITAQVGPAATLPIMPCFPSQFTGSNWAILGRWGFLCESTVWWRTWLSFVISRIFYW